jgi:4-amino-4-deoxychorismate lyase
VLGRGVVDPSQPLLLADDGAVLRGRAAFETMRVYGGRPFRLDDHLDRLANSAEILRLPTPPAAELAELSHAAVKASGVPDSSLRVVWTPGRGEHDPVGFALVTAIPPGLEEERAAGLKLVSLQLAIGAIVRQHSPWLLPGVKSTSYAINIAAQEEARRRGADDALFLSLEGIVLEGPTSNVWMLEGGTLFTPSLDLGILAGVTRRSLIEAAAGFGVAVEEGSYPLSRLLGADEVFISSSVREVMPVIALDGQPIGTGKPGPMAARMQSALRTATDR